MSKNILVTGAAGYIGAHTMRILARVGYTPIGVDDLSTGFKALVMPGVPFYEVSVGDANAIYSILKTHAIADVIHFAGRVINTESLAQPDLYYTQNTANTLALLQACAKHGVERFLYSSSAGVYGDHGNAPLSENITNLQPLTPYGASKLFAERIIEDMSLAHGFSYVNLRYFNVAGAGLEFGIGQRARVSTHLIKILCEALTGQRPHVSIFGNDYPTQDGTCIRDYVHVLDLAAAHIAALEYLSKGGISRAMNCGYGKGFSVREIIEAAFTVAGRSVPIVDAPRRAGDPACLIADSQAILSATPWRPQYDLHAMLDSALGWEQQLHIR